MNYVLVLWFLEFENLLNACLDFFYEHIYIWKEWGGVGSMLFITAKGSWSPKLAYTGGQGF